MKKKNKKKKKNISGFTIVELITVFAILAVLLGIGIIAYTSIFENAVKNYYRTLESSLLLSGSDYFEDHRELLSANTFTSVSIQELVNEKYSEEVKDKNGNVCLNGEVIVYKNEDNKYNYEVCLRCDGYESSGKYCSGYESNDKRVKVPTNVLCKSRSKATYTGQSILLTIVDEGEGFTLSDSKNQINANEDPGYAITAYLKDGYTWSDNTIEPKTIYCRLYKKVPTIELNPYSGIVVKNSKTTFREKADIEGTFTNRVSEEEIIAIDGVDNVSNKENIVTVLGKKSNSSANVIVTFEPSDANKNNYKSITEEDNIRYSVNVSDGVSKPTEAFCKDIVYNGSEQILTEETGHEGFVFKNNRGTNADIYTVTASLEKGYIWNDNTFDDFLIKCSIKKKEVNVSWDGTPIIYNGTLQAPVAMASSGVLNEEIKLDRTQEKFSGNHNSVASCKEVVGGNKRCDNYKLNNNFTNYLIQKRNITIQALPQHLPVSNELNKIELKSGTLAPNDEIERITLTPDLGIKIIIPSNAIIRNKDRNVVNNSYNVTYVSGELIVESKMIVIRAGSASKTYDGTELRNNNCEVISGNIANNATVTCVMNSVITNVGKINNVINSIYIDGESVYANGSQVENNSNYKVTVQNGQLEVTPRPLTASLAGCEKVYDGLVGVECTGDVQLSGVIESDITSAEASNCEFDNINAGENKKVTCDIELKGPKKNNYVVNQSITGIINRRPCPISLNYTSAEIPWGLSTSFEVSTDSNCIIDDEVVVDPDKKADVSLHRDPNKTFVTVSTNKDYSKAGESFWVWVSASPKNGNPNYEASGEGHYFTWIKGEVVCPVLTGYEGNYDGLEHSIVDLPAPSNGISYYQYHSSDDPVYDHWTMDSPKRTYVGTTEVCVNAVGDANHKEQNCGCTNIVINQAPAVCPTLTGYEGNYDGLEHFITVSGPEGYYQYHSSDDPVYDHWTMDPPKRINVGTTQVCVKAVGDANHSPNFCGCVNIIINPNEFSCSLNIYEGDNYAYYTRVGANLRYVYNCTTSNGVNFSSDNHFQNWIMWDANTNQWVELDGDSYNTIYSVPDIIWGNYISSNIGFYNIQGYNDYFTTSQIIRVNKSITYDAIFDYGNNVETRLSCSTGLIYPEEESNANLSYCSLNTIPDAGAGRHWELDGIQVTPDSILNHYNTGRRYVSVGNCTKGWQDLNDESFKGCPAGAVRNCPREGPAWDRPGQNPNNYSTGDVITCCTGEVYYHCKTGNNVYLWNCGNYGGNGTGPWYSVKKYKVVCN